MPVLTYGLGKFEHVLEVDLQENDHLLLIDASMELLPHCSSNFGHDLSLRKSDLNW